MKTSYFWKATHEPISDVKYVSISRSTPPGVQYIKMLLALIKLSNHQVMKRKRTRMVRMERTVRVLTPPRMEQTVKERLAMELKQVTIVQ